MRPYQNVSFSLVRLFGYLLLFTAPSGIGWAQAPDRSLPVVSIKNDALTKTGFEHYYDADYEHAASAFEKVLETHPDDPAAVNHLLAAVMFGELNRIGALDTSLYSNNSFLEQKREYVLDAKVKERIQDLEARALKLAAERLEKDPNDVEALYARGVTRSMQSTYTGLVQKAWLSALGNAKGSREDHERVLKLDPTFSDAKTIVGTHEYVAGSLPWAVRMLAHIAGLGGNKQTGLKLLREAGEANGETSVDAKVILALFLRREQRYSEALEVVRSLTAAHPRNFLFALEVANILKDSGKGPGSIAAYRKVLDSAKSGTYHDPHLEFADWGLGEALRGQRQFQEAALAYDAVGTFPRADVGLLRRANLAAGEMYDLVSKRELATKKYESVIAASTDSTEADRARRHLRDPYKEP
ncbi:MAG: tetratricopeptide repeat protein [Terriglobales bacterium]